MLNTEDEAPLKKWIVKRLEDISDADSDVLADYVLALLRHESPESEVRALSIEQLEDFLKDNTAKFVDDIFRAIKTKSYLPGAAAGSIFNEPSASIPPTSPAQQLPYEPAGLIPNGGARGRPNGSRKRSYNEREGSETNDGRDPHYAPNTADRIHKQARRGGLRNGRGENMDNRGRRSLGPQLGQGPDAVGAGVPGLSQSPPLAFPGMPPPPPGFPFNPNDPLAAVMAMQAMGFPSLPPMSPFSPTGSPAALAADVGTRRPPSGVKTTPERKNGKRCRDYDEKGFCAMGGTCPYEHGLDHIIVPGQNDEYDPTSALMPNMPQSATSNENPQEFPQPRRGGERGRNRGRGRGSNRGFAQERRGRADFSHAGPNQDRSITTVVVENIPEDHFEEQKVREFFSSFGTIEEVHMQAYKRLALVKYQDWASAKRAYDSPKVIFDNRFVKVYWYKPSANPIEARAGNADARATSSDPPKSADEMQIDIDEIRKKQEELQKAHEEKMKKIKETEDSKRELEKRRGEFLKNQAELAARMAARNGDKAKPSPSPEVQGSLGGTNGVATPIPNGAQSQGSSKTEALKAQLAALEAEAQSLGIDSTMTDDAYGARGRGRGRGVYRGRGDFVPRGRGYDPNRGGYRGRGVPPYARGGRGGGVAYKLDNRPKRVTVSGVNFDEKKDEGLRQYLLGIGEFENIEPNPDRSDSQIITFKDRATAEKFAYGSAEIPSVGKLEIAWVSNPTTQTPTSTKPGIVAGAVSTDGDTSMQGDGSKEEIQRGLNEDYDVAEDDDRWMVE